MGFVRGGLTSCPSARPSHVRALSSIQKKIPSARITSTSRNKYVSWSTVTKTSDLRAKSDKYAAVHHNGCITWRRVLP